MKPFNPKEFVNGLKIVLAIANLVGYIASMMLLMHGNEFAGQDVSGWWMSEKFDGWRAIWTGERLESRQGIAHNVPDWFLRGLPEFPLDCELWLARGKNHTDVARAVRSNRWQDLRLVPFDIPFAGHSPEWAIDKLYSTRFPQHVTPAVFTRAGSTQQAVAAMRVIAGLGGEGVMLRRPYSAYQTYRTDDLLKLKP